MAKLSARGRKELFRLFKVLPDTETTESEKVFRVMMSDRRVLVKHVYRDKPGSPGASIYGGSNYHAGHWTVVGRTKKEVSPEQWLQNRLKEGWIQVIGK
jgi:hypothetical protein